MYKTLHSASTVFTFHPAMQLKIFDVYNK
ncbi:hypothetical protein Nmel_010764, partial [Mimus melanotis]